MYTPSNAIKYFRIHRNLAIVSMRIYLSLPQVNGRFVFWHARYGLFQFLSKIVHISIRILESKPNLGKNRTE